MRTNTTSKQSRGRVSRSAAITETLTARPAVSQTLTVLACILTIAPMLAVTGCSKANAALKLPDTEVLVATPVQRDVPVQNEWVATTDGYVNAEIRPQVSGYIVKQDYKEGAFVHKGEVLFEIDPRPFQATL